MQKNIRAGIRAAIAILAIPTVVIPLTIVQGFVVGPLLKNYDVIPGILYNGLRRLLGYKIEFNKASAPLVQGKPVWYVANHMSIADFIVLGSKLDGTFAGKGDVLKWPGIAQMARAARYIGLRRSSEFNAESRAKIAKNFNAGANTIMFPEGTTSDGKEVHLFRAALPSLLFGEKAVDGNGNEVTLKHDIDVQPVAIRVLSIEGKTEQDDTDLRARYAMYDENKTLRRLWKRLQIRETRLELTVFEPLNPKKFSDAKELMNTAALNIASVVNPGQTSFTKAAIPTKT